MEWVKWVIPLIAVAVWILANLARMPREQPRPPARRPQPFPPPPNPEPPQRESEAQGEKPAPIPVAAPVIDVDRFLDEVNRRRREAERRKQPRSEPAAREERRRRESADLPSRRAEARWERPTEARPRPTLQEQAEPVFEVVPFSRTTPAEGPATVAVPAPAAPPPPATASPPPAPPTVAGPLAVPAAVQVMSLLHDRKSLPALFLLREVLGPPVSLRPRGRRV